MHGKANAKRHSQSTKAKKKTAHARRHTSKFDKRIRVENVLCRISSSDSKWENCVIAWSRLISFDEPKHYLQFEIDSLLKFFHFSPIKLMIICLNSNLFYPRMWFSIGIIAFLINCLNIMSKSEKRKMKSNLQLVRISLPQWRWQRRKSIK